MRREASAGLRARRGAAMLTWRLVRVPARCADVRQDLILVPAIALVGLTFVVWMLLYWRRIRAMRARRVSPEAFKTRSSRLPLEEAASASDNFQNLLELPALFYVLVLALLVAERVDATFLVLAWGFVLMRVVHSIIHVGYNRVMHRFVAYFTGALLLWAAWLRFAWIVLRQ
jgi:hypothetical protein